MFIRSQEGYNFNQMIDEIRRKVSEGFYEFSKHAVDQIILRNISLDEFADSVGDGNIIEDYPGDKYGPSCLILGWTEKSRPLHIQCTYPSRPVMKVITLYEPDPAMWIGWRQRR